jgi:hypothetical protein
MPDQTMSIDEFFAERETITAAQRAEFAADLAAKRAAYAALTPEEKAAKEAGDEAKWGAITDPGDDDEDDDDYDPWDDEDDDDS